MIRSILFAGAVPALVAGLGVVAAQPGGGGPPPAMVSFDAARLETVEQWREVTGELQPVRRTVLAAQQDGWVLEILPREGDHVKSGDVVARLDGKMAELDVQRAEAVVKKWDAEVAMRAAVQEKAQRDVDKFRAASAKQSASATEVADAMTDLAACHARCDQAAAERDTAQAELGLARKRVEDMTIRAPITGIVKSKRTEVGQWLARGDPVVEIVQLDTVEAWLDIPEAIVRRVQRARAADSAQGKTLEPVRVQVRITALEEVREAEVVGVVPAADPLSRLVPVRIALPNADELIKPGMSVTGLVPTGNAEPALTIHKDALLRNDAGSYVYYSAGGNAAIARVEVLFAVKDRLAVRSERLTPGAQLVVQGNERLFPGATLVDIKARPPGAAPGGDAGKGGDGGKGGEKGGKDASGGGEKGKDGAK